MSPARRPSEESLHEMRLANEGRRAQLGAWYTAPTVVEGLLGLALDPLLADRAGDVEALEALRVVDPACGDGRFLVAAARRIATALETAGRPEADAWTVAAACVLGVDRDLDAAELARRALTEAVVAGGGSMPAAPSVVVDDAIAMDEPPWALSTRPPRKGFLPPHPYRGARWADLASGADGFDLVVGNPPFLGQLRTETRGTSRQRATWRGRFGDLVSAFTDGAAYFLLLAEQLARPDHGVVALVLPIPLLATRDGTAIRRHVLARTELAHLWVADERTFAARVEVCAAVLVRRPTGDGTAMSGTTDAEPTSGPAETVQAVEGASGLAAGETGAAGNEFGSGRTRLWSRLAFVPGPLAVSPTVDTATWSGLLATHFGVPERTLAADGELRDRASATAGFRDQYYGLTGCVVDQLTETPGQNEPKLVTSGAVDPARVGWGHTPIRFQKVERLHPRVQVGRLDERVQAWARSQLVPKVLVATQTRVLEAVVDTKGDLLPSVPLVSVVAHSGDPHELDRIAALLTSPPITMLATRRHAGSGFGGRSLRLSAADLLALPLPRGLAQWDIAAASFRVASGTDDIEERHAALVACGRAMNEAFGLGADLPLLQWWVGRLPDRCHRQGTPDPKG
jgi:hypothetical protein